MRSKGERRLLTAVVTVSLGLTVITVWAVHRQGQALRQREWADLVSEARAAAARREAAFIADVQRLSDAAAHAWQAGGIEELDALAARQRFWWLFCVIGDGQPVVILPHTLLEEGFPGLRGAGDRGTTSAGTSPGLPESAATPGTMLEYFKRVASSPDPLTRAGALLAAATYEQQLGRPLSAARILAEAASLLRATPGLARFAFRAELERIESLLAAGDPLRAKDALQELLRNTLSDHPARIGDVELARLRGLAESLGEHLAGPIADLIQQLETRARRRRALKELALATLARPPDARSTDEPAFVSVRTSDEPVVIAHRTIDDGVRLGLVVPVADVLIRYWKPREPEAAWQVQMSAAPGKRTLLVRLGPAFGESVLVPSARGADRLHRLDRRRLATVAVAAVGSAGAWLLVIWMLARVMHHQRELARLRSRFVADVSHELKTPLALIRLLSETVIQQRVRDPQRLENYLQTIARESERLTALLENILDLGRIESGRKRYEFGACDVAAVARQAWALFEAQFAAEQFDAQLEIAADLPIIQADAAALQQVLVNLLQNASRYGKTGRYVRLSVGREGGLIVFRVTDRGIGMTRDQLDRLGDSFFRADDTRVRQTRGAGLGLAIVNHIVAAHRGRLDVHSRPGEGSTFTVWIPATPVAPP